MKKVSKKALRARVEQLEKYIDDVAGVLPPWPEVEGGPWCVPVPGHAELEERVGALEERVAGLAEGVARATNLAARIDGQDNVLRRHNKAIKDLTNNPDE